MNRQYNLCKHRDDCATVHLSARHTISLQIKIGDNHGFKMPNGTELVRGGKAWSATPTRMVRQRVQARRGRVEQLG